MSEIQRSRLLVAALGVVDELGYADGTVAQITSRAKVSRRTFYELFTNREKCLAAMFDDLVGLIAAELAAAELDSLPWRERIRTGLWKILSFFDREPAVARVCVVQTLRGDRLLLERWAEILERLASAIDEGRLEGPRGPSVPPLTAEGLVGAAHSIVYTRLLKDVDAPLASLLGDLMGMIVLPYLGPEAARREQARSTPPSPQHDASGTAGSLSQATRNTRNPLEGIPIRITYRTALVLRNIAEQPGISNREVATSAGISDQGQTSKLLSRLERLGLAENTGEGHAKGEPNAWALTPTGVEVAQSVLLPSSSHRKVA